MAAVVKEYGGAVLAAVGGVAFFWHAGTVFAVQTGVDYADDRGLGKRRLLMKRTDQTIRRHGNRGCDGTGIDCAGVGNERGCGKGNSKSRALCETDTAVFEGYWRSR